MNNYNDKIVTIKETEKQLLEFVRNRISNQKGLFNNNVESIVKVLDYDSKMVKKYEAVVMAQKQIEELSDQIKNAKSVNEIIEIRKKLNYYINKIKGEMKKRGIEETEFNNYCANAANLRKGVSEYIRYLKREDKISKIEYLNRNLDSLSIEDSDRLKKLVKNELSYGKKNIAKYLNKENAVEKVKPTLKEELEELFPKKETSDINKKFKEELEELFPKKETSDGKQKFKEELEKLFPKKENNIPKKTFKEELEEQLGKESENKIVKNNDSKEQLGKEISNIRRNPTLKFYKDLNDYLDDKVNVFESRYRLKKIEDYNQSKIKNLKIFTKNLPKIINNKSRIKLMIRDFNFFYRQAELVGFCEYTKKNNSIFGNIKKAFKGSPLKTKEEYYAIEHQKCIDWIKEFCDRNNLSISYQKLG